MSKDYETTNVSKQTDIEIQRISVNNMNGNDQLQVASNAKTDVDEEMELIKKSYKDEKTASFGNLARFGIVFLGLTGLLAYQIWWYSDYQTNRITRTDILPIGEIDMPYFFMNALGSLWNVSVKYIEIQHNNTIIQIVDKADIKHVHNLATNPEHSDFEYDSTYTHWTTIDTSGKKSELIFLPPYGMKFDEYTSVEVVIQTEGVNTSIAHSTDGTFTDEYLEKLTDGWKFGITWTVGSMEDVKASDSHIDHIVDLAYETLKHWERMHYTMISTVNFVFLEFYEKKDLIKNKQSHYYDAKQTAVVYDRNSMRHGATNNSWVYTTSFLIHLNPQGTKTEVTTDRLKSLVDVFAEIGGYFSLLNTASVVMLGILLAGVNVKSKQVFGYAKDVPLTAEEKRKIRTYLIEIGIIKFQAAMEREANAKQMVEQKA